MLVELRDVSEHCATPRRCTVSFSIEGTYVGQAPLPPDGVLQVAYRVSGTVGGSFDDTFSFQAGRAYFPRSHYRLPVATPGGRLRVVVIGLAYDGPSH